MKGPNVLEEAFSDTSSASIVTYNYHQDTALKLTVKEGGKHNEVPRDRSFLLREPRHAAPF
jgi:hypothetical protein